MRGIYRWLAGSPGSPLAAIGVLLSVATVVLFLADLQARYWDRIASAKTDAQSFAKILAEHTALTFEDVDRVLRHLKNLGVSFVLDNCGAGYSAASYLTSFPFDKIKIDRSIGQGFASRRDCAAAVASVLALAHGLDIATAAKGVESREQFEALQAAGVDFVQGYLFGRPVPHCELDLDSVARFTRNVA